MTLNVDSRLDGSNIDLLIKTILKSKATAVCLQEVTIVTLAKLKASKVANHYAIYSCMDQPYMARQQKKNRQILCYGLVFLTKVALVDFWSFPLDKTEQGRRCDIAFAKDFALVNVHAESLQSGEEVRLVQFPQVVQALRRGMSRYNITTGLLCGDLNSRTESKSDGFLNAHFVDTNQVPERTLLYVCVLFLPATSHPMPRPRISPLLTSSSSCFALRFAIHRRPTGPHSALPSCLPAGKGGGGTAATTRSHHVVHTGSLWPSSSLVRCSVLFSWPSH
jgi:hypothetical protein